MAKNQHACPKCGHRAGNRHPMWLPLVVLVPSFLALLLVCFLFGQALERMNSPVRVPPTASPREDNLADHPEERGNDIASSEPSLWDGEVSDELLKAIQWGVVKIETGGLGRPSTLGSGFVLRADGLIVTNHHVIAEATQARVRFADGSDFEVLGYAAVSQKDDLAILKISSLPLRAIALPLSEPSDPQQLSPVFAVGHPYGLDFSPYDGRVSLVLDTANLPMHSQRFLQTAMGGSSEHRWIQHTAQISEGNSGGPLLDRHGSVVGINTWVDTQSHFGYALLARYLKALEEEMFEDIAPLEQYAKPVAQLSVLVSRLTPDFLDQLSEKANRFDWRPQTDRDFNVLQQLSWSVTYANSPESFSDKVELSQERRAAIAYAADQIVASLARRSLGDDEMVRLVNDFAVLHLSRPHVGVVFFARVDRIVEGGGKIGAILRIEGHDRKVYLSLDNLLTRPPSGAMLLVLGINQGGQLRYGENPLDLHIASVVISRTLLPIDTPRATDP